MDAEIAVHCQGYARVHGQAAALTLPGASHLHVLVGLQAQVAGQGNRRRHGKTVLDSFAECRQAVDQRVQIFLCGDVAVPEVHVGAFIARVYEGEEFSHRVVPVVRRNRDARAVQGDVSANREHFRDIDKGAVFDRQAAPDSQSAAVKVRTAAAHGQADALGYIQRGTPGLDMHPGRDFHVFREGDVAEVSQVEVILVCRDGRIQGLQHTDGAAVSRDVFIFINHRERIDKVADQLVPFLLGEDFDHAGSLVDGAGFHREA